MTVPPLRYTGDSANITWYAGDGWSVEVLCSSTAKQGGRIVAVPPKYHFRVSRLGPDRRRVGKEMEFTYEPKTRPRTDALPDRTVTRLVREHVKGLDAEGGDR